MNFHYDIVVDEDFWYRLRSKESIISLNGPSRSGKTTQAMKLVEWGHGVHCPMYTLRDRFCSDIYDHLERLDTQKNVEVLGIASIPWMIAEFHWRVKPLIMKGMPLIMDHYLWDCCVDMLEDLDDLERFVDFLEHIKMPVGSIGKHFYIDIDYPTYLSRGGRDDLIGGGKLEGEVEVPEDFFLQRRERYQNLVERGYLIYIDGMHSTGSVGASITSYLND